MNYSPKILIVEDDPLQRQALVKNILQTKCLPVVEEAKDVDGAETLITDSLVNKSLYQLFLLDIHLSDDENKHEGFDLAKLIRSHTIYQMTPLIFLTSNRTQIEFALNNFHCYNYIKKPYDSRVIANQVEHLLLAHVMKQDTLVVKDTKRIAHRLNKDNILYLESNAHTLSIICSDSTVITRDFTLSSIEGLLGGNFFRCHKRFIVNMNSIRNYDNTCSCIQIEHNTIPVGRVYKDTLLENLHTE